MKLRKFKVAITPKSNITVFNKTFIILYKNLSMVDYALGRNVSYEHCTFTFYTDVSNIRVTL